MKGQETKSPGTPETRAVRRGLSQRVADTARRVKRATISDLDHDEEGFLTLGTLLAAKRGEVKRLVRMCDTNAQALEHWLFDSENAIGNTITVSQFEIEMAGRAASSARDPHVDEHSNGNGAHSAAGQHPLPDIAANGMDLKGETSPTRLASAHSALSRTGSAPPPLLAHTTGRVSLPLHEGGGVGGEWFHSESADPNVLNLLRDTFGIEEQHLADITTPSLDGPKVSFSQGETPKDDYLFIVAHELRLECTKAKTPSPPKSDHSAAAFFGSIIGRTNLVNPDVMEEEEEESANRKPMMGRRSSYEAVAAAVERDAGSDLQLEEVQLAFFFFPDRGLLISIGNSGESEFVRTARRNLLNRRSAIRRDCASSTSGGASSLLIVLLDALMDQVFPILDIYGDALEGLSVLLSKAPSHMQVRLSHRLKARVTQIRRYMWDAKGLFMELRQDMCGCIDRKKLLSTLIDSADQMEKEAEAYLQTCTSIETFYASFQDSRMNATLFTLTTATICLLPLQCLTGIWGMNFEDMPELGWEHGYAMFWCLAAFFIAIAILYTYRASRVSSSGSVILLEEAGSSFFTGTAREKRRQDTAAAPPRTPTR